MRRPPDQSIVLALIHNNDEARNAYIRPRLAGLASDLGSTMAVQQIEIAHQPPLRPHSTAMALLRDLLYWKLGRDWGRYRLLDDPLLPSLRRLRRHLYRRYVVDRRNEARDWRRSGAIEMLVTDKHIRAWERFLESGADVLVCFEDDAVFKEDSATRLRDLLALLREQDPDTNVYADLAGGCALPDLRIDRLEERRDARYRYYKKPVTNTACVYLLTRPLTARFHAILVRRPWLRLIGVDWMMNGLIMTMDHDVQRSFCVHGDPTLFEHGSFSGAYTPWQRTGS